MFVVDLSCALSQIYLPNPHRCWFLWMYQILWQYKHCSWAAMVLKKCTILMIFIYPNLADNMTSLLDLPFFSAYWYHSISAPYQISGVFGWYTVIFVPRCGFSHIPIFWWMSSPQMALTKYGVCADGETFWTTGIWWFPFLHCERSAARYFTASRPAKNQAQNHLTPFLIPDKKPVFFLDDHSNYIHI